jgi:GT2 family glycosyltransferase
MFSVIIPTYNRPDALKRTVSSILSLNISSEYEIIIVNDYPEVPVTSFEDRRIRVIENETNLGRSGSRNAGARAAKYPVLFFIDDDIEVKENLFDKYISEFEKGFSAIFSNVKNVRTDGKYSFLNDFLNTRGANKENVGGVVKSNYFTTAFCSVKKDFFDKIGGFDENFSGYGWEDPEIGLRIERNDGKISFFKTDKVYHYHDKTVDEWVCQIENSGRNLEYLVNKHPQFKKNISYNLLTSALGAVCFNSLFYSVEKFKAKKIKGRFGYISYTFLFYAAIYRSLTKIKKQV